jgi:hypothetical protein
MIFHNIQAMEINQSTRVFYDSNESDTYKRNSTKTLRYYTNNEHSQDKYLNYSYSSLGQIPQPTRLNEYNREQAELFATVPLHLPRFNKTDDNLHPSKQTSVENELTRFNYVDKGACNKILVDEYNYFGRNIIHPNHISSHEPIPSSIVGISTRSDLKNERVNTKL